MGQPREIQLGKILCAGLLAVLLVACASKPSAAQLETRSDTKMPYTPFSVVSGDFNRDGKLDIAVSGGALSVLLGNGDGTFQAPVIYSYPLGVPLAVGDFNGDGKLDLVVGGQLGSGGSGGNNVNVLLGNGDGTFQAPLVSPTNGFPTFLAVGDFNNDHKLDLVIIDDPGDVSVLLGNGDGTFQAPSDNNSFPGPHWIAVGDFNNDHRLDVAVSGFSGGSMNWGILLGNGDGTLQPALIYPLDYTPGSVAAGDFNHDGNLDVVLGGYFGPSDVAVYLGNGDGSFQPGANYGPAGGGVLVGDFNGDGYLDIVTDGVYLLLGNGDGTFGPSQLFPVGRSVSWMLFGDFNGDRKPDVVISDSILGEIMMLNTGVVNFSPSSPVSFAAQLINTTSRAKTVKLTNTGAIALTISSIRISEQFQSSNACGNSVGPGASCTISITFSPKSAGPHSGLMTIVDSASSRPQVIELSGSGTVIGVSPSSLSFGSQKVGTKSAPQVVTAVNHGGTQMLFEGINIGGKDRKDFSETDNCTGRFIPPGGACQVSVTFAPTKTGARSGSLFLVAQGTVSPQAIPLTGKGN